MPTGFDVWASQFDGWRGPPRAEEIDAILDFLEGRTKVLDVGGGTGRYALPLVQRGHQLTLLDRSGGMLREAAKKGLGRVVKGDASRLPFSDVSFEAVLFVEMLHLVRDWVGAVREMGRVTSGPAVAVIREREPDHRRIMIETRAEMLGPLGLLDEGVRALCRMLPPGSIRTVWSTEKRVDLVEPMRAQEMSAVRLGEPQHPEVVEAALAKVVKAYGSTEVLQVETVRVAKWEAGAFR